MDDPGVDIGSAITTDFPDLCLNVQVSFNVPSLAESLNCGRTPTSSSALAVPRAASAGASNGFWI